MRNIICSIVLCISVLLTFISAHNPIYSDQRSCDTIHNTSLSKTEYIDAYEMSILSALVYSKWPAAKKNSPNLPVHVEFEISYGNKWCELMLGNMFKRNICRAQVYVQQTLYRTKSYSIIATPKLGLISAYNRLWYPLAGFLPYYSKNASSVKATADDKPNTTEQPALKSLQSISACPSRNCYREKYHLLWFFDGWSENSVWHDTELLIAENIKSNTVAFVFRGSESAADLYTNSQRFEPAKLRNLYRGCTNGSIHRGMLNAYFRVNTGTIVKLKSKNNARAFLGANSRFDRHIDDIFDACRHRKESIKESSFYSRYLGRKHRAEVMNGNSCAVQRTSLSEMLYKAVTTALRQGKRVICTGHSLGGALASLLALDVLINSHAESIHLPYVHKLHLYTYGEPDFADKSFFRSIINRSRYVSFLANERYRRFVTMSNAPNCRPDIVTTVAARAVSILGNTVVGRVIDKGTKQIQDQKSRVSDENRITQLQDADNEFENLYGSTRDSVTTDPDAPLSISSRSRFVTTFKLPGVFRKTVNVTPSSLTPNMTHSHTYTSNIMSTLDSTEVVYLTPPTYLSSGSARNSMHAHGIQHYIRGILHSAYESDLFTPGCEYASNSTQSNVRYNSSLSYSGRFMWRKQRNINVSEEVGNARPTILSHDVPLYVFSKLQWWLDDCYKEYDNGFSTHVC